MTLFDDFSFTASRHPSSYSRHVNQVSPMSTPTSAYEPLSSSRRHSQAVSDLANKFSEHRISRTPPKSSASYFDIPVPPTASAPAVQEPSIPKRERSWSPPIGGAPYRRLSSSAIRAQRQANIRLLSDSSHLRELSALVEQMVDSGSQCRVCSVSSASPTLTSPSSSTPSSVPQSPVVDEGIDEMYYGVEDEDYISRLNFRRSGDLAAMAASGSGAACVRKSVRIRKERKHRSSSSR